MSLITKAGLVAGISTFIAAVAMPPPPPPLGSPLQGLGTNDLNAFFDGKTEFTKVERPSDGLGPVFNGVSCAQCHSAGAAGGAATNLGVARVTRIGGMDGANYSDLAQYGGPLIQSRSLREFNHNYPVAPEVVPPQARFVSHRITTPLFGDGLIEAIPDATILQRTGPQGDGVQGMANYDLNPDTMVLEVGKFGWKAVHSKLRTFAGDAYLNEMGITNALFPNENLPQGRPIPPGADPVPDPEDESDDIDALATFMRFLAPPVRRPVIPIIQRGEQIFNQIKCQTCHVQAMNTGFNQNPALSNKRVELWSDLLLHRMGNGLADGIHQGLAVGDQWRTAPLWGLAARHFYMHDGRATTLDQAIRLHAGEATASTNRYVHLSPQDRAAIVAFLGSL